MVSAGVLVLRREASQRRQNGVLAAGIDLVNCKAETTVEMPVECPGDKRDVVVRKRNGRH